MFLPHEGLRRLIRLCAGPIHRDNLCLRPSFKQCGHPRWLGSVGLDLLRSFLSAPAEPEAGRSTNPSPQITPLHTNMKKVVLDEWGFAGPDPLSKTSLLCPSHFWLLCYSFILGFILPTPWPYRMALIPSALRSMLERPMFAFVMRVENLSILRTRLKRSNTFYQLSLRVSKYSNFPTTKPKFSEMYSKLAERLLQNSMQRFLKYEELGRGLNWIKTLHKRARWVAGTTRDIKQQLMMHIMLLGIVYNILGE
jgi:hypothetical protein